MVWRVTANRLSMLHTLRRMGYRRVHRFWSAAIHRRFHRYWSAAIHRRFHRFWSAAIHRRFHPFGPLWPPLATAAGNAAKGERGESGDE
jgi:hypothetical protein